MEKITKLINKLSAMSPLPYWGDHIAVSLLIALVTGEPLLAALFYGVREVWQWKQKGHFDHPGFWAPVLSMVLLKVLLNGSPV